MPLVEAEFKIALGRWASGVTIVTSAAEDQIHGMTVSAFCSVSLDPPLILVCADKASITNQLIQKSGIFAANILSEDQDNLSNRFASKKDEHRRFEGVTWNIGATGAPIISNCSAVLDCRVTANHDGGDHVIYIGHVESIEINELNPLVYYQGAYHSIDRISR